MALCGIDDVGDEPAGIFCFPAKMIGLPNSAALDGSW
jgi:hypothetical protein